MRRFLLVFAGFFLLVDPPGAALEAGTAKVEITPPVGTPLNGFGDRLGRSSLAVHDPLWARALYLTDGETQVALVNTDLCMINRELRDRVLELTPTGIPRENIILTATHTHNGPGAMHRYLPLRIVSGGFNPEILEATARSISQAVRTALENKRRAAIGYGVGKQQVLSQNRRHPGGPIDEQIGVLRVDDADGNALALVANLAAHPTSVPDSDHYSISADYPGFYYDELERLSSPGCVAMLLNGAEGDQTIGNPENQEGWARTESVGKLLAVRVKGIANQIACTDAKLRVNSAQPTLPPTIAATFQPNTVLLQTLEIDDLLLTFFPGEPTVEIGLALRQQALARGYAAQFSVGLANDYLMYFVPQPRFVEKTYEAAMNYYGPRIAEWFYTEFGKLMSRPGPETQSLPAVAAAQVEELEGGMRITLAGTPREIGLQRGLAFAEDFKARYQARVTGALISPDLLPEGSLWKLWPNFLDPAPVAVPTLAMAARPLLQGVPTSLFDEIEGMAEGAQMPFDALWLLQQAVDFKQRKERSALFDTPLCTMFAVTGDRAGAEGLLLARNLDWPEPETPVIVEVRPRGGHRLVQAGFTWNTGVYTGMNDAGLVLMLERAKPLGDPSMTGPPIELVARQVLQETGSFAEALAQLRAHTHLRGYTVLLAGNEAGEPMAAVLEFGNRIVTRSPEGNLLFGVAPQSDAADNAAAARYGRLGELLAAEQIVGRREMEEILRDTAGSEELLHAIWNADSRYSVIMEPQKRTLHVAFRSAQGVSGAYTSATLKSATDSLTVHGSQTQAAPATASQAGGASQSVPQSGTQNGIVFEQLDDETAAAIRGRGRR
ncbi:MAG: neutral/alkaline non-lysosomal ceramidase N-terminal domain-containing protein [Candidatus Hydrogenedentes bacterium]|nr:neutral/alkaline non-lysosomal ceramidase N-terminal domain-containing protein [Candidatus Hydrogenedentota bacterium]